MRQSRLNDAAIALDRVLGHAQIRFGIFGGYAIGALGGNRESKDIDCVASVTKQQIINILDKKEGFEAVMQSRQDYVAFLWSDKPNREGAVLVEIFCEQFPGARYSMRNAEVRPITINGEGLGQGSSNFFDPVYIFKGKLRAAALRKKFHDSADLRWIEGRYSAQIHERRSELSMLYIGIALKRYPELDLLFTRLGVDVEACKKAANEVDLEKLPAPAPGDVQGGILG
ncbi:hypothetical protein EJ05DRAFT_344195 [Pseudovirgaria hyperparasitica]|uniref:Uncharacterized protein n=1 Tax=Pseudovirgaria hyperparasitica TaxID=470096 RepID=A0A6A6W9Y5_9PEZI|nr:uncharacterized protein EJ05DRAFT_344195 [Pseudovirgaria hyperparasitica]KAF2759375.1 hypothetical protein EJ05DRAFT_344195 [Pseudovirgaria hyperparasitica]